MKVHCPALSPGASQLFAEPRQLLLFPGRGRFHLGYDRFDMAREEVLDLCPAVIARPHNRA
jgi:hypothetical protein